MTKYKRITGKVFGGNATATGNDPQIAQFGSALANTFIGTTDPEVIQQLPAWGQGWIGAVTPETQYPALPEMTGAMKVLSHEICTLQQEGVSSWDSETIYYTNNFASKNGKLFTSLTDTNQGNDPETDTTNWQEFASGSEWGKITGNITNQTDLQEQLANKVNINSIVIDGQWFFFDEKIVLKRDGRTGTVDLSEILPDTENAYELQFVSLMEIGSGKGISGEFQIGMSYAQQRVTVSMEANYENFMLIVPSNNRTLSITFDSYDGWRNQGLYLLGYRRLGTNK